MPKPLAARQSIRVKDVAINASTVQPVRFVSKTVRGVPFIWTKTPGFPKICLRNDGENGEVYAYLPKQRNSPIATGATWVGVWLEAIKEVWGSKTTTKKSAVWHPAPDTKKVLPSKTTKETVPKAKTFGDAVTLGPKSIAKKAPTREQVEDFDDVVVATTTKATKAAVKAPSKAATVKKASVSKTEPKKGGKAVELGSEFDDDMSFPEA